MIDFIGSPQQPATCNTSCIISWNVADTKPPLGSFRPALTPASSSEPSGSWDSIHVFETVERGRQAHYKLTSTIMLQLITRRESVVEANSDVKDSAAWKHDGEISLSGSMTRQVCNAERDWKVQPNLYYDRRSKTILCRMERHMYKTLGKWLRIWRSRCVICCRRCTLARRAT